MKNQSRYCPSCGRKTKTNNKNPKACPTCGSSMIIVHPKVMDQIDINRDNANSAPLGKMMKNKD